MTICIVEESSASENQSPVKTTWEELDQTAELMLGASSTGFVQSVAFDSPLSSSTVAGGTSTGMIGFWDINTEELIHQVEAHASSVRCVSPYSSNPQQWVSGGDDGTLRVMDTRHSTSSSSSTVGVMQGHRDWVTDVTTTDQQHVVSSSTDGTLRLWDLRRAGTVSSSDALVQSFDRHDGPVWNEQSNPDDSSQLLSTGDDQRFMWWSFAAQ